MNNHSNKIIVICDSDVILKGLAEVLGGSNSDEVILLHHPKELIDYPYLLGYLLLIIPTPVYEESKSFIHRMLSSAKEVKHLHLSFIEKTEIDDEAINIHDNQSHIIKKVNEQLSSFGEKRYESSINELTKREVDVLQLVAKGLANKEIADKLAISTHTVISHRKNISEKTGIKSASGLTMYAVLKKIIDIDEISTSDLV